MDTDGVDILHIADGDSRVERIPHNFVFYLFIAFNTLFHQHLPYRGKAESVFHNVSEFLFVVSETSSRAAQRECGTQNHGITYPGHGVHRFFYGMSYLRRQNGFAYFKTKFLEKFPILCGFYTVGTSAEHLHLTFLQNPFLIQLHSDIEPRLTAYTRHYGVGTFVTENFRHVFEIERFHINSVGYGGIRHNGSGVGVDQHHFVSFFLESKTRLRSRIIEFRRLPYDYRSAPYDKYFLYIRSLRHFSIPPSSQRIGRTNMRCPAVPARFRGDTAPKRQTRLCSPLLPRFCREDLCELR